MLLGKALLTVGGVVPGGVLFRSQNGSTTNTTTSYTVTVPLGVTSIGALAIGAGGGGGGTTSAATAAAGGGGGGGLSYSNSIAVTPGETLTVNVPNQSNNGGLSGTAGSAGRDASILREATTLLLAQGGRGSAGVGGGTAGTGAAGGAAASGVGDVKQSGGAGGNGNAANDRGGGGGGAAGYAGTGGVGGNGLAAENAGSPGTGGAGGGGASYTNSIIGGPGGGVLWYGQGSNGSGGANTGGAALNGTLGSSIGGRTSVSDVTYAANSSNMIGLPGAGGPGAPSAGSTAYYGGQGAGGAVRILWNKTFDWAAPLNVTSNTITIPEYTTSATADIVTPQVQLGDTLYFVDYAMGATLPAAVTPSGFTILGASQTSGTTRLTVYTRQVLSYTESGVTLTGATGSTIMSKFLIVVRGTAGAARSDWQSVLGGTGSSTAVQSAASFTYTQTGTVGISTTTTTIDAYAMGVPVCFLFFGSGTGSDINPDTDMTMTGATTLLGPSAKTCMKVLCFDQSTTSLSVTASTADLGSTNTSSFWFQQFY